MSLLALCLMLAPIFAQAQAARPNIVVIVADDAAFMDFGVYGGEARTPNIDKLARAGTFFSNYHTSPLCTPSRAMLLTGVDNHRTGHATIEEVLAPQLRGRPGYTLRFEPGVVTVAERLKDAGYRTLMSGKWHLGRGAGDLPNSHGFQRSLALDASGADNYAPRPYMPYYNRAPWFEDGKPARLPARFYSSDLIVDRLLAYIDEQPAGAAPYFAYLAFQAVHIPVQAPRAFSDSYAGRFDDGWEALRAQRWKRARTLGLIPSDAPLAPWPSGLRRWADLNDQERRIYARSMEVYAGMLEAMDQAIGRLVRRIEARGEMDRTLFVITSDNGPEPSDPVHAPGMNIWMPLNGYHWGLDRLGEQGSLGFIGPEWATAIASPHAHYKFYASGGGLKVPLIVSGPGVAAGGQSRALVHVTDIAPTVLEIAGAPLQAANARVPISGRSLAPALRDAAAAIRGPDDFVGVEVSGNAALIKGDYKIVRNMAPVGDGGWRLFNLAVDPGETRDLASAEPQRLNDMIAAYDVYAAQSGVLALPAWYRVERQVMHNGMMQQLRYNAALLVLLVGAIAVAIWFASRARRARREHT
ncbi:MAG: arylsulfatase [Caulobacterales bacterium]